MMSAWESNAMDDDVWHEIAYEAEKFGVESSCFLQVALVNLLWCGSSQVLGQVDRWTWVHGKWHGRS